MENNQSKYYTTFISKLLQCYLCCHSFSNRVRLLGQMSIQQEMDLQEKQQTSLRCLFTKYNVLILNLFFSNKIKHMQSH